MPFFIEETVGLKNLEAGFKKISVNPKLGNLKFIDAEIPVPNGIIEIKADKSGVGVRVPKGTEILK